MAAMPVWAPPHSPPILMKPQHGIGSGRHPHPLFGREPVHLFTWELNFPSSQMAFYALYDVSPDEQHFLTLREVSPERRLVLVENWLEDLKAKTSGTPEP